MTSNDITMKDVFHAAKRVHGTVRNTPFVHSDPLYDATGKPVWLKMENLQETGSFKLRGAANSLSALSPERKQKGVLAFSTGNHGRAVAWVARRMGIRCVVCLSKRVPSYRARAMEKFGAEVVRQGESQDDAYEVAKKLEQDQGLTMIKPFDDPYVIAGQGTMALEMLERVPRIETLVVPVSGGGLAAGVARVMKGVDPSIRVIGVSMDCAPAMYHSIKAGRPVEVQEKDSIADALLGGIGLDNAYTFSMVEKYVDTIELVTEEEIEKGILFAFHNHGILIEGAAAVTLSFLLKKGAAMEDGAVAGILSGGNVDTKLVSDIVSKYGEIKKEDENA